MEKGADNHSYVVSDATMRKAKYDGTFGSEDQEMKDLKALEDQYLGQEEGEEESKDDD